MPLRGRGDMTALWLAWRDVASRRGRLALAVGVVVAGTALVVAVELLARSREQALGAEVDQVAPQIQVVPSGVSASALARNDLGRRLLPAGTAGRARRLLGNHARLVIEERVLDVGEPAAAPSSGAVNLLRVYLRPGAPIAEAEARLRLGLPGANVIRVLRGEVADGALQEALARHRILLGAIVAAVMAACLSLAAHLDASERRLELATLVAVGGSRGVVLWTLAFRSALVGGVGGGIGLAAGTAVALGLSSGAEGVVREAASLLPLVVGASALLAACAAVPTALSSVARDPVADLQEGAA